MVWAVGGYSNAIHISFVYVRYKSPVDFSDAVVYALTKTLITPLAGGVLPEPPILIISERQSRGLP